MTQQTSAPGIVPTAPRQKLSTRATPPVPSKTRARELTPSFLVTHTFVIAEFEQAIETLRTPPPNAPRGKVMVVLRKSD
jgi:hypothetical protein